MNAVEATIPRKEMDDEEEDNDVDDAGGRRTRASSLWRDECRIIRSASQSETEDSEGGGTMVDDLEAGGDRRRTLTSLLSVVVTMTSVWGNIIPTLACFKESIRPAPRPFAFSLPSLVHLPQ